MTYLLHFPYSRSSTH